LVIVITVAGIVTASESINFFHKVGLLSIDLCALKQTNHEVSNFRSNEVKEITNKLTYFINN